MVYLKTKKMTDISQNKQDLRQRAAGILYGFQGFLTQNLAVFVEIDDIFDFSDTPWSNGAMRGAGTRSGNTFKPAVRQSWPQTWLIISYLPGK
jgi:hypothetical protein